MDDDVVALATARGGYVSTRDLLGLGYSNRAITALVRRGDLVRIRHGAYCPTVMWSSFDAVTRHLALCRAVLRRHEGRVALCGVSGLVARGVAVWGVDLSAVEVWRLQDDTGRREAGVRHHRGPAPEPETVDGLLLAPVEESLWQFLRAQPVEPGLVSADSAFHRRAVSVPRMREVEERGEHDPGARRAGITLRLTDGGAETAGETRCRYLCYEQPLPAPRTQREVRDDRGELIGRSDLGWDDCRHLGEFDGKVKYMRSLREGETPEHVVIREKQRQDALADEGWGMTRIVWSDLAPKRRESTAAQIRRGLDRSVRAFGHLVRPRMRRTG